MEAYYFKEHIFEELDGARHYVVKAYECKSDGLSWAKTFIEMASAELDHASNLYKMFNEYFKQFDDKKDLKDHTGPFREELIRDYLKCSSEIKYMMEMFNKQ